MQIPAKSQGFLMRRTPPNRRPPMPTPSRRGLPVALPRQASRLFGLGQETSDLYSQPFSDFASDLFATPSGQPVVSDASAYYATQAPGAFVMPYTPSYSAPTPAPSSGGGTDWTKILQTVVQGASTVYQAKTQADAQIAVAKAQAVANPFANYFGSTAALPGSIPGMTSLRLPSGQIVQVPSASNNTLWYVGLGALALAAVFALS